MMKQADERFFEHGLPEYSPDAYNEDFYIKSSLELLKTDLDKFSLKIAPDEVRCICSVSSKTRQDPFIGMGAGGYLLLALKQYETSLFLKGLDDLDRERIYPYLESAKLKSLLDSQKVLELAEQRWLALKPLVYKDLDDWSEENSNLITYLMGAPGVLALAAHLYYYTNNVVEFKKTIATIQDRIVKWIIKLNEQGAVAYELLYGIPGFLFVLLDLQIKFQFNKKVTDEFKVDLEKEVVDLVLTLMEEVDPESNGIIFQPDQWRLFCTFFNNEYFGAAHGTFGLCYILLAAYKLNKKAFDDLGDTTKDMLNKIERSYKSLIAIQLPSGNFPCYSKSLQDDKLVQWCHGSTGAIPSLLLASEVLTDPELKKRLLESAEKAGENVWKFGALKKGFNLCHGILGNSMAFISLYRATKNKKWLHHAFEFSLLKNVKTAIGYIENYEFKQRACVGMSDEPYSLLNGLAGEIYFRLELIDPMNAK